MKIVYIDAQNTHKSLEEVGWIIDRGLFFVYLKRKFKIDVCKIFLGYIPHFEGFYKRLRALGYELVFKETMLLPNGTIKGNVDIDIAIHCILDMLEGDMREAYLVTGDGDYNTLVHVLQQRNVLGRVLIPHAHKASKLLKKSAGSKIQVLHDIRYFLEKKNPDSVKNQGFS